MKEDEQERGWIPRDDYAPIDKNGEVFCLGTCFM